MTSDFSDALETFYESFLRGKVHTAQPGTIEKVVSSNPPIVNVQPAFMTLREGSEEAEKRPVIPNVPFMFPVFGGYGITGEITVGAEVLLIASERCIKTWMEQGGTVDPAIDRMFDIADAIAIPSIPNKKTEWTIPETGVQIGTIDGETVVHIEDGTITIKTPDIESALTDILQIAGGADFVALAQKVDDTIQALMDSFNDPSVVATPQDGGTALYGLLKTQLNTRVPAVGSVAASKLKTD